MSPDDRTESAVERKVGSGQPKSARSETKIAMVKEMICSQEDEPSCSKSTLQIAVEKVIREASVGKLLKLTLVCFSSTHAGASNKILKDVTCLFTCIF